MWTKNKSILLLAAVGVLLFSAVQGIVLPQWDRNEQIYAAEQLSPLTHDLESIMKYQNKYMGNASNLSNLMHTLPLSEVRSTMELHPDSLTADIIYHSRATDVDPEKLEQTLIYNATAAFALIDNLKRIRFRFDDRLYETERGRLEEWYGKRLSSLTDSPKIWKPDVQHPLAEPSYVKKGISRLFTVTDA
ncbi:DUF4825 domain-containing protein [Paenibacillus sp. SAF-054]|uniref:DUF4825 domain-containing protein n=1 Tax=unclassified Paenibacillus TaxID=185978 RepID=UPI003F7D2DC0